MLWQRYFFHRNLRPMKKMLRRDAQLAEMKSLLCEPRAQIAQQRNLFYYIGNCIVA